jgi:hypothetical protein
MSTRTDETTGSGAPAIAWASWAWVVVPFLYGLYQLVLKIPAVFGG